MSRQTLSATVGDARDFRTSVPAARSLMKLRDAAGKTIGLQSGAPRGLNSRTINTNLPCGGNVQIFPEIWARCLELKIRHIVKQKETEPIRRVFCYTREQTSSWAAIRFSGCAKQIVV